MLLVRSDLPPPAARMLLGHARSHAQMARAVPTHRASWRAQQKPERGNAIHNPLNYTPAFDMKLSCGKLDAGIAMLIDQHNQSHASEYCNIALPSVPAPVGPRRSPACQRPVAVLFIVY